MHLENNLPFLYNRTKRYNTIKDYILKNYDEIIFFLS